MKTLSDRSCSDRQSNERVRDGFPATRGKLQFTRNGATFTSTQSVSASRKHCVRGRCVRAITGVVFWHD